MDKWNKLFIEVAEKIADLSHAERKKVGAVLVKDKNIIGFGYNGTPRNFPNKCEIDGKTIPEVIHAEVNVIAKVASSTQSTENCDLYITLSPCHECSKLIIQSKIKRVFYKEVYREDLGLNILKTAGIECIKL